MVAPRKSDHGRATTYRTQARRHPGGRCRRLQPADEPRRRRHAAAPEGSPRRADRAAYRGPPRPHRQAHRRWPAGRLRQRRRGGTLRRRHPGRHGRPQPRRARRGAHRVPYRHQPGRCHHRGRGHLGDGVNIAARLEGIAEPGAIFVSRAVRNSVRDKLGIELEDLGERPVKNIARPVRVSKSAAPTARRARLHPPCQTSRRSPYCPSPT